jgi:hypothetical protein
MKTTLLLNDQVIGKKLLLQKPSATEVPVGDAEAVAGCNCDRWGHPCPCCVEHNDQPEVQLPISVPVHK